MKNSQGFTTIELILAILIAGVIIGAVGTFLTFNLQSFNRTTDIIDIQYEGQLAMTQLTDIIRESKGIAAITDGSGDAKDKAYEVQPVSFQVNHTEWDASSSTDSVITFDISYDDTDDEIDCVISGADSANYILARYITDFRMEPIGNDFEATDNVIIRMTLEQGGASIDLESQVKMRNKH